MNSRRSFMSFLLAEPALNVTGTRALLSNVNSASSSSASMMSFSKSSDEMYDFLRKVSSISRSVLMLYRSEVLERSFLLQKTCTGRPFLITSLSERMSYRNL